MFGGRAGETDKWRVGEEGEGGSKRELLQREWGQIGDEEPECICACAHVCFPRRMKGGRSIRRSKV